MDGRSSIVEKVSLVVGFLLPLAIGGLGGCFDGWKIDNPHARPMFDLTDLGQVVKRIPCTSNSECIESGLCIDVQYLPEKEVPERKDTCVSKHRIVYVSSSSTETEPDGTQAKPFKDLQLALNASISSKGQRPYVFVKGDFVTSMVSVQGIDGGKPQIVLIGSAANPVFKRKISKDVDWTTVTPRTRLFSNSGSIDFGISQAELVIDGFDFYRTSVKCQHNGYVTFRRSAFDASSIDARSECNGLKVFRSIFIRSERAAIRSRTNLQVGNSLFIKCLCGPHVDEFSGMINIGGKACISGVTLANNIRDRRGAMRFGEGSIFCMPGANGNVRRTIIHENDLTRMEPVDMSGPQDLAVVRDFSVPRDLSASDMMLMSDLTSPDMSDVRLQQNCNGYPVEYTLSPMTLANYSNGPKFLNSMGISAADYRLDPNNLINKSSYIDKEDASGECLDPEERGLDFFGADRVQGEAQDIGFHETSPAGSPLSQPMVPRKLASEITISKPRKHR